MNILAFRGSPRKGGNSDTLLDAVLQGVVTGGGTPDIIRLCDHKISPCISCGGCDKTGKCVVDDDMTPLYEKILNTNRIILASPIFFYGITAQAKAFIDRMQALWNRKRLLLEKGEYREDPNRKGLFLSVAASRGPRVFEGAVLTMKYGFDAMDVRYSDELLLKGIDQRGAMADLKEQMHLAEELGREFVSGE